MKRELYKFTESIPANAGYSNYEYFQEGAIVCIEEDAPAKYCVLCDEEGRYILDDEEEEIFLDWSNGLPTTYPIWEDKLIPYKEVEVPEEENPQYICLNSSTTSVVNLSALLSKLPTNAAIYLDTNGSIFEEFSKKYGVTSLRVLLENGLTKLIAVIPPVEEIKVPDINDLFNSLRGTECLTIHFHKND